MMRLSRSLRMLPLAGALALAACDVAGPTGPIAEETALSAEDAIALDVLSDAGSVEAALSLAGAPVAVGQRRGMVRGAPAGVVDDVARARLRFQEARDALLRSDRVRAAERAREARRLLARAIQAAGGGLALMATVERAETLADGVAGDPDAYDDPGALRGELDMLGARVRARVQQGDSIGAAERAVLAEQRVRHRRRDPRHRPGGAEVYVALGGTAVSLATRLLDEQEVVTEVQTRFLDTAVEYQRAAEAALDAGDDRRAVNLADLAIWTSLKAVVLPDPTEEEARAILVLAQAQYEAAVATGPQGVAATLLERARALLDTGQAVLEAGSVRGVASLWRSAVISTWVLG